MRPAVPATPSNAALIVIDMQKCMADPASGERNNPQAEADIGSLSNLHGEHARISATAALLAACCGGA